MSRSRGAVPLAGYAAADLVFEALQKAEERQGLEACLDVADGVEVRRLVCATFRLAFVQGGDGLDARHAGHGAQGHAQVVAAAMLAPGRRDGPHASAPVPGGIEGEARAAGDGGVSRERQHFAVRAPAGLGFSGEFGPANYAAFDLIRRRAPRQEARVHLDAGVRVVATVPPR
jgi:hypothetical protein